MVRQIVIEAETPGDSRTMFRLRIDASPIAEGLTAVQAHVLVGEILERIALPKSSGEPATATPSDPAITPRRWPAGRGLTRLMSLALRSGKNAQTVSAAQFDIHTLMICNVDVRRRQPSLHVGALHPGVVEVGSLLVTAGR